MKRYHIYNVTTKDNKDFYAKVLGDDVEWFNQWIVSQPGVKGCEPVRAAERIGPHAGSKSKLAIARMATGMTQQEVADAVGVHLNVYHRWENRKFKPKVHDLMRLGEIFGVDWTTLIEDV